MKDFVYYAPTEVLFGKESEEKVAPLVKRYHGRKVLVHYGGSSAKKSGLLKEMVRKCSQDYTITQGSFKVLQPEDMEAIYQMAR